MKGKFGKRVLSILLACVLVLGYLPVPALAEETTAAEETVETTAATVPETTVETEPETTAEAEPETTVETEPETTAETEPKTTVETEPETAVEAEPETVPQTVPEIEPEDEQPEGGLDPEGEYTPEDLTFDLTEDGVIIMDGSTEGTVKVKRNITGVVIDNIPTTKTITVTGGTATCQNGKCKEIKVDTARPVTIRLRNVRLDNLSISGHCAMTLNGANGAPAKVTLILEGENFIRGSKGNAGVRVPAKAELTIRGEGSLKAVSGEPGPIGGAGIGGKEGESCGTVRIESGTITATGGTYAAGIGGGYRGNGGTVIITGGIVSATGGANAANIGAGYTGKGGTSTISGGVVFEGSSGTVYGNTTLESDFTIPKGKILRISQNASLTIPEGINLTISEGAELVVNYTSLTIQPGGILTNYGTVTNFGTITNQGTIINEGSLPSGISGKITHAQHNYVNGFCTRDNCDEPIQPVTPVDGIYPITRASDLYWFANFVNAGNYNANALVTRDITMLKDRAWGGIGTTGAYSGTFDGGSKTITGLTGTEGLVKGLSGTVKNVILKNVNIRREGGNLGAVAGNCESGSRIENCYSSGSVAGDSWSVGGIAGWLKGTMEGCVSECTVSGETAGGLVGSGADSPEPSSALRNCLYLGSGSIEGDGYWLQSKSENVFRVNGGACTRYETSEAVTRGTIRPFLLAYSAFQPVAGQFPKPVTYINSEEEEKICIDYTPVTKTTTSLTDGWYVADGGVTVQGGLTVSGNVNLILTDGCRLTVNGGIQIPPDSRLTIYRQASGTGMATNIPLPAIIRQPEDVTMVEGEDRSLSVEYTGGTVCQWYLNGEAVEGAIESPYSLAALKAGIYQFRCEITTDGITVVSRSVTVTVKPNVPNPIWFTQEYVTLPVGSQKTLTITSYSEALLKNKISYLLEDENSDVIAVSGDNGGCKINALKSGTAYVLAKVAVDGVTYTARCRVDVTEAAPKAAVQGVQLGTTALTTELFRTDYAAFDVILLLDQNKNQLMTADAITLDGAAPKNNGVAVDFAEFTDEQTANLFDLVVKDDRTLLVVPKQSAIDNPKPVAGKYTSKVRVTVDGKEFITDTALKLAVKKSVPKLKAAALTFNSFYTGQSQAIKLTGATATKYVLTENKNRPEWLDYKKVKDGVLTLTENPTGKNGSVFVTVTAEGWAKDFDVAVPVKLTYAAPKLKLSATTVTFAAQYEDNNKGVKLRLLCANKKDTLEGLNVSVIQAPKGFVIQNFDPTDGSFILKPTAEVVAGPITLQVSIEGTKNWVPLNLNVKTQDVSFKLKTSTVTLNADHGELVYIPVTVTPADYKITEGRHELEAELTDSKGNPVGEGELQCNLMNVPPDSPSMLLAVMCGPKVKPNATYKLSFGVKGGKKTTLTIKTQPVGQEVSVSVKTSGAIDPTDTTSAVQVKHTFKNYHCYIDALDDYTVTAYKAGNAKGVDVSQLFDIGYILWNDEPQINSAEEFVALFEQLYVWPKDYSAIDPSLTYKMTLSYELLDGTTTTSSEVVLPVKHTPIKLKLSKTSLSLNKAVNDKAVLDLACLNKGYALTDVVLPDEYKGDSAPLDIRFVDGKLTVEVNEKTAYGATYKIPIQATKYDPAVTLTVKIPAENNSKVTASLKAKGTIDVVRDGTYITVTPTYKNYMGLSKINPNLTVESSGDKWKTFTDVTGSFVITKNDNGTYTIAKKPGAAVDTSLKYRAKLTFDGSSATAYVNLSIKSGTGKFAVTGTPVLYKTDRFSRDTFRLTTADKTLNPIEKVTSKDARFQVYSYGNGEYAIGFKDNQIPTAKLPTSVTLNIYCKGVIAPAGTVTLKLQVR